VGGEKGKDVADQDRPKPPSHLEKATREWWQQIAEEFELESHHLRLLTLACEQWDRAQKARRILDKEGVSYDDRFGFPKARPEVAIAKDASIAFARLMRELALDDDGGDPSRPPRVGGGS
jgi:P27 family predicted phage terminase small subunit